MQTGGDEGAQEKISWDQRKEAGGFAIARFILVPRGGLCYNGRVKKQGKNGELQR